MSRYEWREKGKTISIGWDKPMNTFFAQVHNDSAKNDRDYCELWLGQNDSEFTDLDYFSSKLPFVLPEALQLHLLSDQFGIEDAQNIRPIPPNISKRF